MSKLSVAVGSGLAACAFVAPSVAPTSHSQSQLRGRSSNGHSMGGVAGVAGISISGLAAMALSRPIAAKTQVVRNAYDASKEKILEGIWEGFVLSPRAYILKEGHGADF